MRELILDHMLRSGGDLPTISDANVLLGRLGVQNFSFNLGVVSKEEIRTIFQTKLGDPLGVNAETAAAAVLRMANTIMAGAIRMVSISLGKDPRDFSLFAFGGAGPLHATALASELGVPEVLIPARPGITNAIGCVVADLRHDFVQTVNTSLDKMDIGLLSEILSKQALEGEALVKREPVDVSMIEIQHSLDMQFSGQTHLLRVPLEKKKITPTEILLAFEQVYFDRFRIRLEGIGVKVVNVRTVVTGRRPEIDLSGLIDGKGRASSIEGAQKTSRKVWFGSSGENHGWLETPVFEREKLPLEFELIGPAILEQMDTTILLGPENRASSDKAGNILIKVENFHEA